MYTHVTERMRSSEEEEEEGREGLVGDTASMLPRDTDATKHPLQIKTLGCVVFLSSPPTPRLPPTHPLPPPSSLSRIWEANTLTYIGETHSGGW